MASSTFRDGAQRRCTPCEGELRILAGCAAPLRTVHLRILGLARMLPLAPTAVYLSRLAATGLGLAMLTGLGLFSVRPGEYAANPAFLAKLALIALGLINILAVHLTPAWRATVRGAEPTKVLRVGAAISILIWGGAIIAGRWIGFI